MDSEGARVLAAAWVDAWGSGDPERVLDLLHDDVVVADPVAGKVRAGAVPDHVRDRLGAGPVPVHSWLALPGADSVAVVCTLADGARRVDTLVLADDGRIVRVMRHG